MKHDQAVRSALRANNALGRLFYKAGSGNERGELASAYRVARKALAGETQNAASVTATVNVMRRTSASIMQELLAAAARLGRSLAVEQLKIWDERASGGGRDRVAEAEALAAWQATLDAQLAGVRLYALSGGDEAQILGDDHREGILTPAPILREGARLMVTVFSLAFAEAAQSPSASRIEWYKQAVAAIDERTTECCLRVHGQVRPMDKPFKLTGEPRYADELDWSPFHWYCRTSVALVPREFTSDETTERMIDAARAELQARKDGRREIHPANAFSRRGQ